MQLAVQPRAGRPPQRPQSASDPWREHTLELQNALCADIQQLLSMYNLGKDDLWAGYDEVQRLGLHQNLHNLVMQLQSWDETWSTMINVSEEILQAQKKWNISNLTAAHITFNLYAGGPIQIVDLKKQNSSCAAEPGASSCDHDPLSSTTSTASTMTGTSSLSSSSSSKGSNPDRSRSFSNVASSTGEASSAATSPTGSDAGSCSDPAQHGETGGSSSSKSTSSTSSSQPSIVAGLEQVSKQVTALHENHYPPVTMMNHSVALVRQLRSTLAKFHHTRWRALMKQRDSSEDTLAREKHEYDKFLKESELNDEEIGKSALKSAPWLMLGVFGAAKIASDVYGKYSTRRKEYERVEKAEELLKVHEKELQLLEATTKKIDDQANAIGEKMWCYAGWWGFVVNDWEQFNRAFLCFNQTVRAAAGDSSRKQAFQTLDAKKLKKMEHTWLGGPEKLAEILRKQQQAKEEVFAENPTSFAEHEIDDQSVSIDETIDFEEVQAAKAGKKTLEEAIGSHLLHLQRQLYMLVETAERFYLNRTKVR